MSPHSCSAKRVSLSLSLFLMMFEKLKELSRPEAELQGS